MVWKKVSFFRHTTSKEVSNEAHSSLYAHLHSVLHCDNHHRMEPQYFLDELLSLSSAVNKTCHVNVETIF